MKKALSKTQAKEKIESYFSQSNLTAEQTKRIKRLAAKYRISLKPYKSLFCQSCLHSLKQAKIRTTKEHKIRGCPNCKKLNKVKMECPSAA